MGRSAKTSSMIGGGFAGLSAGVALAERGFRVALLESKPALGGRAYSFADAETGDFVDNGQHVLMGCYAETLEFSRPYRHAAASWFFIPTSKSRCSSATGARGVLETAHLPGPLHMSAALLRYRHLTPRERVSAMAGAGCRLLRCDAATARGSAR